MVVANLLHTRYREIQLVSPGGAELVKLDEALSTDLEASFVPTVAAAHYAHIGSSARPYGQPPPLKTLPRRSALSRALAGWDLPAVVLALIAGPGLLLATAALQRRMLQRLKER
jgi:hypothetical protein